RLHPDAVGKRVAAPVQRGEGSEARVQAEVEPPQRPEDQQRNRDADRRTQCDAMITAVRTDAEDAGPDSMRRLAHPSRLSTASDAPPIPPRASALDCRCLLLR